MGTAHAVGMLSCKTHLDSGALAHVLIHVDLMQHVFTLELASLQQS